VNKYLKLDQEVPYLAVDSLLVHPGVLVQSHEKKRVRYKSHLPPLDPKLMISNKTATERQRPRDVQVEIIRQSEQKLCKHYP
jgi:hypothetical protein